MQASELGIEVCRRCDSMQGGVLCCVHSTSSLEQEAKFCVVLIVILPRMGVQKAVCVKWDPNYEDRKFETLSLIGQFASLEH